MTLEDSRRTKDGVKQTWESYGKLGVPRAVGVWGEMIRSRRRQDTAPETWTFDREKSRHLSEEAKDVTRGK